MYIAAYRITRDQRPAHHRGDLVGGVGRERSNVLIVPGTPPAMSVLLSVLLDAAISLDPI